MAPPRSFDSHFCLYCLKLLDYFYQEGLEQGDPKQRRLDRTIAIDKTTGCGDLNQDGSNRDKEKEAESGGRKNQ